MKEYGKAENSLKPHPDLFIRIKFLKTYKMLHCNGELYRFSGKHFSDLEAYSGNLRWGRVVPPPPPTYKLSFKTKVESFFGERGGNYVLGAIILGMTGCGTFP